jgi:hypothetical protein
MILKFLTSSSLKVLKILVVILFFSSALSGQWKEYIDWSSDLEELKQELLKTHPDLYKNISEAQFLSEIENLKSQAGDFSNETMVIKIQQMIAKIGDPHLNSVIDSKIERKTLPIRIRIFDGRNFYFAQYH